MFSCLQILEAFLWFVLITLLNVTLIILTLSVSRLLNLLLRDRKSGSAGMPRPISYAVFCLKKKKRTCYTDSADLTSRCTRTGECVITPGRTIAAHILLYVAT